MKKLFILYQTDVWKTKSSRVCFGVFSSANKAIGSAKEHDLSDIEIVCCEVDKFLEI